MKKTLAAALAVTACALSAPVFAQAELPSFAPVIKKAAPAVVNIGVKGTVAAPRNPFFDDPGFRRFFGLPPECVRVRTPFVGGGFGLREIGSANILAVALSRQAGRPVRYLPSQAESFRLKSRHRCRYEVRSGVDARGRVGTGSESGLQGP